MFEPFVMIAMCDCKIDPKTKKKVCTPFLRAFSNGCQGIHVLGDFDHDGKLYEPRGEVSSDAKCCDCCGEEKTVEVCYDLRCLIRREERNGGLENINILGGDGVPGGIINFSPPANDTETIATQFNELAYLGFETWHTSPDKPGFLCVTIPKDAAIPQEASGCRFRRFRSNTVNGGMTLSVSHPNYGAYGNTGDSISPGAPGISPQQIRASNTHFYCKMSLNRSTGFGVNSSTPIEVGLPYASSVLQQANLFRFEFPDNSTSMYVPNYPTNSVWSDIWPTGGVNSATNRTIWANRIQRWFEYIMSQGLPYGTALCYASWSNLEDSTNTNSDVDVYRGVVVLDVPCNIEIVSIYGIQVNPMEIGLSNSVGSSLNNHLKFFDEVLGVGAYTSKPYIDGVGGSTSWTTDCSIPGPFDINPNLLSKSAPKSRKRKSNSVAKVSSSEPQF